MEIIVSKSEDWDLVTLEGTIAGAEIGTLEELLQRFSTIGRYNIILDLAKVRYIGSAGLSVLIRYTSTFRRWERGDLHLAAPPKTILNLLQVAGLIGENHSHFSIYSTVDAAKEAAQKRASQ